MIKVNTIILNLLPNFNTEENWGDISKINPALLVLMQRLRTDIDCPINIHCAYEETGHSTNSQHYKGNACDFHLISNQSFESQVLMVRETLVKAKVDSSVGLGVYPYWNNPGFHLDVRGYRARWGFDKEGQQVSIELALNSLGQT